MHCSDDTPLYVELHSPYEYNNELDTCTRQTRSQRNIGGAARERERGMDRGRGRCIVCAFALPHRQRETPSSSVRIRIPQSRHDGGWHGMAHSVPVQALVCIHECILRYVSARPKWIKCYRLCVCNVWRLCNGIGSELPINANSFSYGFLYTQLQARIHTLALTIARHTFTGMTAQRRFVSGSYTIFQPKMPFWLDSSCTTEKLVSSSCVSSPFCCCVSHCRPVSNASPYTAMYSSASPPCSLW